MIPDLLIYDDILVSNQKETTKMKIKKKKNPQYVEEKKPDAKAKFL